MKTLTLAHATRRILLAAAVATTATLTSQAAYWDWVGKGSGETSYFDDYSTNTGDSGTCWYHSGNESDSFANANHNFNNGGTSSRPAYNPGWDNIVTFRELTSMTGAINFSAYADTITFVAKDQNSAYGISSTKLLKLDPGANLAITSGTYSFSEINFATNSASSKTSTLTVNGAGASLAATGALYIGCSDSGDKSTAKMTVDNGATVSAGGKFALNAGDVTINGTVNVGGDFYVGVYHPGTLTINGGTVEVGSSAIEKWTYVGNGSGVAGTINLNGGQLKLGYVRRGNDNSKGTLVFNGGTLVANKASSRGLIASNIPVTVGAGGGTIDNNNLNVTVAANLDGTSGLTFTGGGTTTLSGEVSYSGQTFVTPGTTLAIANATTKTNILKNGLILAGVPVADQTVITYTSAFEDADLAKVSCPLAPTATFKFTDETKTTIVVDTVGPTINYWTGAAGDDDLSNDANWSSGTKPTGEAYIICDTPETLTKGETFAPTSITFLVGSAPVTIAGDFSGITQIANNSSSMVEFTGAVEFAGNVDVVQNSGAVKFTGGVTGVKLARATDIHGIYTLTTSADDYQEMAKTTVKSDGEYRLPYGTFYKHNGDFHVEARGKAVVKKAKIESGYSNRKLLGTLNGEFKVTDEFYVSASGANYYTTNYMNNAGSGTFIVNKLRLTSRGTIVPADKTIVGGGGVMRAGSGYVRIPDSGSREFGAYADWTMYYNEIGSNTDTLYFSFYKEAGGSSTMSTVVFDTTDYYDSTIGRTITCEAPIGAATAASATNLCVTVKGKGTFVFANTYDRKEWFSGGLTVQDTATVEVKANAKPGKGAITLGAGTKLVLNATTLSNTLNLPTGEGDVATIRINGTKLSPGDYEIATVGTGATANVTLDPDSPVLAGRKGSLRVENNKLVLNVKPTGLMVIFR